MSQYNQVDLPNVDCILISGSSGAVGTFLVREFCHSWPQRIYCILREPASFRKLIKSVGLAIAERCIPVFADLSSEIAVRAAMSKIGYVDRCLAIHCAADVSWTKEEEVVSPINVDGTRHFAKLAVSISIEKPFFLFLSTAFISSHMTASMDNNNGYEKTKLRAEQLLIEDFADQIYLGIIRCSLIVGSQIDGWTSGFNNGLYPLIKIVAMTDLPCLIADKTYKIDTVPIDFVFSQILACVRQLSDSSPVIRLVVATGSKSITIAKLHELIIARTNAFRLDHNLEQLPPISIISNRQYDFLMKFSKSWNLNKRFKRMERFKDLMRGYVIRTEQDIELYPEVLGETSPEPDSYIKEVIDYCLFANSQKILANHAPKQLTPEVAIKT
jgi:thioester reductase-like protein